jgi:hypothetical protein
MCVSVTAMCTVEIKRHFTVICGELSLSSLLFLKNMDSYKILLGNSFFSFGALKKETTRNIDHLKYVFKLNNSISNSSFIQPSIILQFTVGYTLAMTRK